VKGITNTLQEHDITFVIDEKNVSLFQDLIDLNKGAHDTMYDH